MCQATDRRLIARDQDSGEALICGLGPFLLSPYTTHRQVPKYCRRIALKSCTRSSAALFESPYQVTAGSAASSRRPQHKDLTWNENNRQE